MKKGDIVRIKTPSFMFDGVYVNAIAKIVADNYPGHYYVNIIDEKSLQRIKNSIYRTNDVVLDCRFCIRVNKKLDI